MVHAAVRFFAGVATPAGYKNGLVDLYRPEEGWRVYLIKGGPGTGKSTLLRRSYEHFLAAGVEGEVFCCSADPDSLDGVRFPAKKLCIFDATAPHALEPRYWGACEQLVPLSACMDEGALFARREEYRELADECGRLHTRCRHLLGTAAAALKENERLQREALDEAKLSREAARLAAKEWGSTGKEGREERRWLSAITPDGVLTFFETVQALCPRIYTIVDEDGAAASRLLAELKQRALAAGQSVIACPCPLSPQQRLEHLLLPDLGVAFITANHSHEVDFPTYRRLHATRFLDGEMLKARRERMQFNRRAADELLLGATEALAVARQLHTRLEALCGRAMDWERATTLGDALLERL